MQEKMYIFFDFFVFCYAMGQRDFPDYAIRTYGITGFVI